MGKGVFFSIMAGLLISLQNIFNARLSSKIGSWAATTFVHGTGFVFAITVFLFMNKSSFSNIGEVNKLYLIGGITGTLIIFCVTKGVSYIGVSYAVTILIVSQIVFAFLISVLGFFEEPVINVTITKLLGLILMIIGVIIYQFK